MQGVATGMRFSNRDRSSAASSQPVPVPKPRKFSFATHTFRGSNVIDYSAENPAASSAEKVSSTASSTKTSTDNKQTEKKVEMLKLIFGVSLRNAVPFSSRMMTCIWIDFNLDLRLYEFGELV